MSIDGISEQFHVRLTRFDQGGAAFVLAGKDQLNGQRTSQLPAQQSVIRRYLERPLNQGDLLGIRAVEAGAAQNASTARMPRRSP
jgi:hypothetical protein